MRGIKWAPKQLIQEDSANAVKAAHPESGVERRKGEKT